jgi:uncharacterized protein (TIGR03435 family)
MLEYQHNNAGDLALAGRNDCLPSKTSRPTADRFHQGTPSLLSFFGIPVLASISLLSAPKINAQSPANPSTLPTFDVASVHAVPNAPGDYRANLGTATHGEVTLTNATLSQCLRYAFGINNDDQISGPDWIKSREFRYDIVAKAPPETPIAQLLLMLQGLLTEHFTLAIHRELKQKAFLALRIGKKGLKMQQSRDGAPPGGREIAGAIVTNVMPMDHLTMLLSRFLRQPVVDMTGLKGNFEVKLEWTPESVQPPVAPVAMPDPGAASPVDSRPSIFVAVQEQLGLALESRKGPLEVIAVDRADKVPIEN